MAIITGTTKTRFPEITDPNSGIGPLFARLQRNAINFLRSSQNVYENTYMEEGTQNIPAFSTVDTSFSGIKSPSVRKIITQRPQATIFVKKRMFGSLRNNYDIRYMNDHEKLFLKASKLLMDKKSQDLSYYESLLNLTSIFRNDGFLNIEQLTGQVLDSFFNAATIFDPSFTNATQDTIAKAGITDPDLNPYYKIILQYLKLQELNRKSKGNVLTTWITDPSHPDTTGCGEGVGVIELNLVANVRTTCTLESGQGSCSLTIQDPYKTLTITETDIELALRQALADKDATRRSSQAANQILLARAKQFDQNLTKSRNQRGLSEVNFDFLLQAGNPVGTIVATGQEFDIYSIDSIDPSQAFSGPEKAVAAQILTLLREYSTNLQDVKGIVQTINAKYNDVRQRMRNEFIGHTCIQQMDGIHIFMNSRSRDSTPAYDGRLDNEVSLLGNLFTQQQLLTEDTLKAEHEQIAPDIPWPIYRAMRDKTVFRQDGVQIFSGVVDSVSTSYEASSGTYTVSVNCKDNMEYLKLGRINTSPSLSQPGGMLEDPLTPFNLATDPATGLISKTPTLSDVNKSRLKYLRFDDGPRAGKKVNNQTALFNDRSLGGEVLSYQHVPGLVYQWKSGIISETLNVNMSKPLNGIGSTLTDVINEYGLSGIENPFAGLDVADVISFLVTGRPHSYASFLNDSLGSGTYNPDPTNQSKFYFNFLFDFLERGSGLLGDFIPAVPDLIDPVKANQLFVLKQKISGFNSQLNDLKFQRASLEDKQQARLFVEPNLSGVKGQIDSIAAKITQAVNDASQLASALSDESAADVSLNVVGNSVTINFDQTQAPAISNKLKYQLKKKAEDVRYNQDRNYLVVSDKYDSDVDIQAFAKRFKKYSLFDSDYKNPFTLCLDANRAIGFEFFADSQGNIIFRPPEYNKTPKSLLLRLIELSRAESVSHVPPFLDNLFSSRKKLTLDQIQEVELQILEQFILLGFVSYAAQINVVTDFKFSIKSENTSPQATNNFNNGIDWSVDQVTLIDEVSKTFRFSPQEQRKLSSGQTLQNSHLPGDNVIGLLCSVRNKLREIQGRPDLMKSADDTDNNALLIAEFKKYNSFYDSNANVNRLSATNAAASFVARRQQLAKTYQLLVKQASDFEPVNKNKFFDDSNPPYPKYLLDLLEDDQSNSDGFNSGKRFIIYDEQIIRMTTDVKSPDFTRISVTGNLDFISNSQDGSVGGVPNVLWASAVDFDLWRQFGYRDGQQIFRPDFTAAEEQCAPYAVFKLQEQRKKIHQAQLTLAGNEHYQVGDVVYLNCNNMLYYVTSVSHSFAFDSGSFTTDLQLAYGRALGEYIPTSLDIIGKHLLASTRNGISNLKSTRATIGANHVVPLETLFVEQYNQIGPPDGAPYDVPTNAKNTFKENATNQQKIDNAITKVASRINKKTQGEVAIEIRTYYIQNQKDGQGNVVDNRSLSRASIIGQWVYEMITRTNKEKYQKILGFNIDAEFVLVADPIDISDTNELNVNDQILRRFPTSTAWMGANLFFDGTGVALPINAVDIVFLIEKSQYGDQPTAKIRKV